MYQELVPLDWHQPVEDEEEAGPSSGVPPPSSPPSSCFVLSSGDSSQSHQSATLMFVNGELSFSDYDLLMQSQPPPEMEEAAEEEEEGGRTSGGETQQEHQVAFASELKETSVSQFKKKHAPVGGPRRRHKLNPTLQGLMGEAHIRFARGEYKVAEQMCMAIIQQAPMIPEPYQTMAMLYESQEDYEKYLQFSLIAAYLNPSNADEWVRLAEISLERGDAKQALTCYSKAINATPTNIDLHLSRCSVMEQMGDKKGALRGYLRIFHYLKPEDGALHLQVSKMAARMFHALGEIQRAREVMDQSIAKYSTQITSEDVNLMLELQLNLGEIKQCLTFLVQHCGVRFLFGDGMEVTMEGDPSEEDLVRVANRAKGVQTHQVLAIDLRVKLIITLIRLGLSHLTQEILVPLLEENPEEVGDLYLDVAEAFMGQSQFSRALPLLEPLVNSSNYSLAAVWLRYAECLTATLDLNGAANAYETVLRLAPLHLSARISLSSVLQRLGKSEQAILCLTQDSEREALDPGLLYERCQLLLAEGRTDEFLQTAKLLLYTHLVHVRNRDELDALARCRSLNAKTGWLKELRAQRPQPLEDHQPTFNDKTIPLESEWSLFRTVCEQLLESERFSELQRITYSALASRKFQRDSDKAREIEFMCLLSSFHNHDAYHGYSVARDYVARDPDRPRAWNVFNMLMMRANDMRHNRFLMRQMGRNPRRLALQILNAHNCLIAGTYKYSLSEYMAAFKQAPNEPLLALMLGVCFIHMACQKFSAKKHALVSQGVAFMSTYKRLRGGGCQEVYYNLGRAMQQLSLFSAAITYYKAALECDPDIEEDRFDMRREAAFNLALIYRNSGAHDLANMYLYKYIVV